MTMARLIFAIYVLLLSWSHVQKATGEPLLIASYAISIAEQLLEGAIKFRDIINNGEDINEDKHKEEVAVFRRLDKIDHHISEMHSQLADFIEQQLVDKISEKVKKIQETIDYVNEDLYPKFIIVTETPDCIEKSQLEDVKNSINDYKKNGLENSINQMHRDFIQRDLKQESLVAFIAKKENQILTCYTGKSIQQTLSSIYNSIVNADLKALAMKLAVYEVFENDPKKKAGQALTDFKNRMTSLSNAAVQHIIGASRTLWRCDPDYFEEGNSYSKLQQIFQDMIVNKMDSMYERCTTLPCDLLFYNEAKALYKPKSQFAQSNKCKSHCDGYITDCESTGDKFKYCLAKEDDDRRYVGFSAESKHYGEDITEANCRLREFELEHEKGPCGYCLCTCTSTNLEVDRYFSLKKFETSITQNKVITGLRLRLINHVFYIDIREGTLGENATIRTNTTSWKNTSLHEKVDFEKIIAEHSEKFEVLPPNTQVHAVQREQNLVYLDDIEDTSGDFVVTGLRFAVADAKGKSKALKLQVRLNEFDYESGKIIPNYKPIDEQYAYGSPKGTDSSRVEIKLRDGDDPRKRKNNGKNVYKHNTHLGTNQYFRFNTTSRKKNMGQFTIPFIDTQEVAPDPPTPLSGVGLYFRGTENGESGGFMALKVMQYNIGRHYL